MKVIINHKCKHSTSITDVYNQILEMENKTTTPNKVQQKDDPTSKTSEPDDQPNQDHNNSSYNITTPLNITNDKPQIAQNQVPTTTYSPNIDDNNTSIEITNNAECKNNSINDNVTKEVDKGKSPKVDQRKKDQKKHQYRNTKKGDFIIIIEMEDMTPNKRQTSSQTKSLTTPTEKKNIKK